MLKGIDGVEPGRMASRGRLAMVIQDHRGTDELVFVHPEAFNWVPQGSRLLVVVDPPPEQIGLIHVPESTRELQTTGAGVVMACTKERVGNPSMLASSRYISW